MKITRPGLYTGIAMLAMGMLAVGCNQSPESATNPDNGSEKAATESNPISQVIPGADSLPYEQLKFTDISGSEIGIPKQVVSMSEGPMSHMDPATLAGLKASFIARGQVNLAKRLVVSYDFNTGDYKGIPESSGVLKKTSAWSVSDIKHHGYADGNWLPYVGNSQFTGSALWNGKLYGWNAATPVTNGVTPSLRYNVTWSPNSNSWTAVRSWNEAFTSGNSLVFLKKFKAWSTYAYWNVCYSTDPNSGYPDPCNNSPVGNDIAGVGIYSLKFGMYYFPP